MILARDPFCVACGRRPSQHVDHITPKASGGTDQVDNLRGLCDPCHRKKTARDGHTAKAIKRLANTMRRSPR